MHKARILFILLVAAMLFSPACSSSKAPGVWVTQDTETGDSFTAPTSSTRALAGSTDGKLLFLDQAFTPGIECITDSSYEVYALG